MLKQWKLKFNINKLMSYLICICIVLSVSNLYTLIERSPLKENYFKLGICIFSVIGVILMGHIYARAFVWTGVLGAFFVIYTLFSGLSREFILYFTIPTLCLFFYIYTVIKNHALHFLMEAFVKIMVLEAAISVFCYFFGTLLDVLPGRINLTYYWADASRECSSYFYLYFDNTTQATTVFSHFLMRNTGIFPEAPGHSGMLAYAMIFAILAIRRDPKRSKIPLIILAVAMVSTLSTKAFIILILMVVGWYLLFAKNKMGIKYIVGVGVVVIGIVAIWYILADKSVTGSYSVRMDDMFAQLKAWGENIFFGIGYSNTDEIVKYFTVYRSNDGLSMGIFNILARGGLYLFSIYAYSAIRYLKIESGNGRIKEGLLAVAILVTNLFISASGFSMPYMMFLSIGLSLGKDKTSISI